MGTELVICVSVVLRVVMVKAAIVVEVALTVTTDDVMVSMPPVISTCTGATTNHTQAILQCHHNVFTTGVYYNAPPMPLVIPQNNLVTTTGLATADSIITSTSSNSSQNY